jgi:cell division protein FtsL
VVLVALTAVVLGVGVLPTRTVLDRKAEVAAAEAELVDLQDTNAELEAEVARLSTDEELERLAREELGLVRAGEETYVVLPPPADDLDVPTAWPFSRVRTS